MLNRWIKANDFEDWLSENDYSSVSPWTLDYLVIKKHHDALLGIEHKPLSVYDHSCTFLIVRLDD